jgi:hypothetical protein
VLDAKRPNDSISIIPEATHDETLVNTKIIFRSQWQKRQRQLTILSHGNSLGLAKMGGKQQSLSNRSLRKVGVHLLAVATVK